MNSIFFVILAFFIFATLFDHVAIGLALSGMLVVLWLLSRHLSKLNQAGLMESSRSGKRVFYRLSQRGQSLIELFS